MQTHWQIVCECAVLNNFLSLLSHLFFGFMAKQALAKAICTIPIRSTPCAGEEFLCILEVVLVTNAYFTIEL